MRLALAITAAVVLVQLVPGVQPAQADTTLAVPWSGQIHALDCEAASLQSMLAYQGVYVSQDQILAAMGDDPRSGYYDSSGTLRWGNAYNTFVGNVDGSEINLTGYGTFWQVVTRVANQLGDNTVYASGAGVAPSAVYSLIAAGHPVQTWVTFDWALHTRHDYLTFDGSTWIPWAGPVEHSVVVIGVSDTSVYVSDPDGGKGIPGHNYPQQYWIAKSTFEAAYGVYGDMAVATGRAPQAPVVAACGGLNAVTVSWNIPDAYGAPISGFTVTMQPGGVVRQFGGSTRSTVFDGLSPGTGYTFTVTASDIFGMSPADTSGTTTPSATAPVETSYLAWYDLSTRGMSADNLHLVAHAGGATASSGCLTIRGIAVAPFDVGPGQEQVLSFPAGTIGGPVEVSLYAGNPVIASQRVLYYRTFNEVPAQMASAASTSLYLSWYDLHNPGFETDNVHVINPGPSPASVTVSIPGCAPQTDSTLAAGSETYFNCPGAIGGPVAVASNGNPVLASQRVLYQQTFNEVGAQPGSAAASNLELSWYDLHDPGFSIDNVHVVNPGPGTASVTIRIPGCGSQNEPSLGAGQEAYFGCPGAIGGPVTISASSGKVLASQRVVYQQSFDEMRAQDVLDAQPALYFAWYDAVSPGFSVDNVHVINPGPNPASVTVLIPGCSILTASLTPGAETFFQCQGGYGGPVTVTSSGGEVLASQRVDYYQSFNEVLGSS